MKKRMDVLFFSFLLVVSLLQCYGTNETQVRLEETDAELGSNVQVPELFFPNIGGNSSDIPTSIVFVAPDIVYIAGTTTSDDFPVANAFQEEYGGNSDCFVMKLNIATNTLVYSTYIGGSSTDEMGDIAVDDSGNVYATGSTFSNDFPTVNPFQADHSDTHVSDAFVFKLNPTGDELIYSTFFGEVGLTSGEEYGYSIDIDTSGNAYVGGLAYAGEIQLVNPIDDTRVSDEGFLLKFNSTGNGLEFSTYIGGSDYDIIESVTVDASGNVYAVGTTESGDLVGLSGYDITHNGDKDSFVIKINSSLNGITYSTYIGGSGTDETSSAVIGSSGSVYVTGHTSSTNFPTANAYDDVFGGAIDCFVFGLSSDGQSLTYGTYLGGSSLDYGVDLVQHASDSIFVTGHTHSEDFPTVKEEDGSLNGDYDCYVSKLNLTTSALDLSTYLGGSGDEYGTSIDVNTAGNAIVTGYTDSADFTTIDELDSALEGINDCFFRVVTESTVTPFDPIILVYIIIGATAVAIIAAVVCMKRK